MPCLGNLLNSPASALELTPYPELKPVPQEIPLINPALVEPERDEFQLGALLMESNDDDKRGEITANGGEGGIIEKIPNPEKEFGSLFQPKLRLSEAGHEDGDGIERGSKPCRVKWPTTAKLVQEWSKRKIEQGVPGFKVSLPFLVGAPKLVQCSACQTVVYHEEEILCSVRGCRGVFHLKCAKECLGFSSSKQFKCPQHECFLCKQKNRLWRCIRCPIACHDKCAPFPEHVVHFPDQPGEAICWRHSTDWRLEKKDILLSA
ncbi:UNVERIFIED_CONTAM: Histone-lysine N-methyltransferase ASHR3 [Sesamum radiatum]|uniref:Histone-lysine N-methyltransferase ASHR3 n=1 Tax=Sesamum radiatum TaxID=300843 RepID=A0AAW2NB51_SESRA